MKDNILAKVLKKMGIYQEGRLDIQFLSLVLILLSVGIVMLFSASYAYCYAQYGNSYHFIIRLIKRTISINLKIWRIT